MLLAKIISINVVYVFMHSIIPDYIYIYKFSFAVECPHSLWWILAASHNSKKPYTLLGSARHDSFRLYVVRVRGIAFALGRQHRIYIYIYIYGLCAHPHMSIKAKYNII